MRVKKEHLELDNGHIRDFFRARAGKYKEANPYAVTMYQDEHPELVKQRDEREKAKLLPLLGLDKDSRVLDLACGIGRWADAVADKVGLYLGIDFSAELVSIAEKRINVPNVRFRVGAATELDAVLAPDEQFNRVLIVGLLMYLNDDGVQRCARTLEKHCDQGTVICIREPLGIDARFTLKDHFSPELNATYNAVYRTRDELVALLAPALLSNGFTIGHEGFLFGDQVLNNRKETSQYFFILENTPHS
ncbi:MAG: class I SAM-dependent methyltransferase [Kiritimatiellae bacterium]|nr:class I SAM-dependent methyltransferase [Kiritimatiellia bacterium]